jgi:hypothetical protein
MDGLAPPGHSELGSLFQVILWDTAFDNECSFTGDLQEYFVRVQRDTA